MKLICAFLLFSSFTAFAAQRVECDAGGNRFSIASSSSSDIKVTFRGETVVADGFVDRSEVDLVARFSSIGEMTLFAKIGKSDADNYAFYQGKRFSVSCR